MDSPAETGGKKGTQQPRTDQDAGIPSSSQLRQPSSPGSNLSTSLPSAKAEMLRNSTKLLEKCLESGDKVMREQRWIVFVFENIQSWPSEEMDMLPAELVGTFYINLISCFLKLKFLDKAMIVAKNLSLLQDRIQDIRVKCSCILSVANALFQSKDYLKACLVSGKAIELLGKGSVSFAKTKSLGEGQTSNDLSGGKELKSSNDSRESGQSSGITDIVVSEEFNDLYERACFLRGLSQMLENTPTEVDGYHTLELKMKNLEKAAVFLSKGRDTAIALVTSRRDGKEALSQFDHALRQLDLLKSNCVKFSSSSGKKKRTGHTLDHQEAFGISKSFREIANQMDKLKGIHGQVQTRKRGSGVSSGFSMTINSNSELIEGRIGEKEERDSRLGPPIQTLKLKRGPHSPPIRKTKISEGYYLKQFQKTLKLGNHEMIAHAASLPYPASTSNQRRGIVHQTMKPVVNQGSPFDQQNQTYYDTKPREREEIDLDDRYQHEITAQQERFQSMQRPQDKAYSNPELATTGFGKKSYKSDNKSFTKTVQPMSSDQDQSSVNQISPTESPKGRATHSLQTILARKADKIEQHDQVPQVEVISQTKSLPKEFTPKAPPAPPSPKGKHESSMMTDGTKDFEPRKSGQDRGADTDGSFMGNITAFQQHQQMKLQLGEDGQDRLMQTQVQGSDRNMTQNSVSVTTRLDLNDPEVKRLISEMVTEQLRTMGITNREVRAEGPLGPPPSMKSQFAGKRGRAPQDQTYVPEYSNQDSGEDEHGEEEGEEEYGEEEGEEEYEDGEEEGEEEYDDMSDQDEGHPHLDILDERGQPVQGQIQEDNQATILQQAEQLGFKDLSEYADHLNRKPMHKLTIRNYRTKSNQQQDRYYFKQYDLDIKKMMTEFKVMYNGKGLEFNKPIIINDVVYLVRLNMNIDDYKFEAEMDPMIDRDSSDPNELLRVSEKFFSKERLKEKEFIKLLMEISIRDKLLPIDSIYTIGTFVELVERIVMPTLLLNFDLETIHLEAWPFGVDMLMDKNEAEIFGDYEATHCLYHLYDNNIRLVSHLALKTDAPQEEGEQDSEALPIEICIEPEDFRMFFEAVTNYTSIPIYQSHEDKIENYLNEPKDLLTVEAIKIRILQMLNNRQKVVIKDEDYRLPPNVLETDFMKPVHGKDIVSTVITHLLCNVERMLKDMNIELFKNEYYQTTRYAKLSTNLSKLQLFVIRDYEDQRRVVVSSRVVQISEDYTSQEFCSEIYAHSFSYDLLEDKYLVSLDQVEMDDKLIVFKFLLDSLFEIPGAKWESQEAAAAKLKEGGSDEHHADIYMTYPAIEVASKRFFIGDTEPVPVTLRILSQAGMPLGLSCCVYDVANTTEYPALFLIIHPNLWRKEPGLNHLSEVEEWKKCTQRFFLLEYLALGGWDRLIENIKEYTEEFLRNDFNPSKFFFDSFECFM